MKTSEQTDKIDAAISAFQASVSPVAKNKVVEVDGDRSKWKSGFASFAALLSGVRQGLSEYGIALYQGGRATGAAWSVVTRVSHAGQWIEVEYPVKASRDGAQAFGGGISFAKRWGLRDLLAIEVPDDAEEASGYREARRDARPAKRAPAPAGIAAALEAIRVEGTHEGLVNAARSARAAHPQGEGATQVERVIADWFVDAAERCTSLDDLTALRDVANTVKPRGVDAREAIGKAARRLEP